MGLIASIYKTAGLNARGDTQGRSYSNGGISERVEQVTIVNVEGPFEPNEDRPAVLLVPGNLSGTVKLVVAVMDTPGEYSEDVPLGKVGPMFGGCYVDTSDARLNEAVVRLGGPSYGGPVPLHDRYETQAEYDALSR
jgi:hypothetical protein